MTCANKCRCPTVAAVEAVVDRQKTRARVFITGGRLKAAVIESLSNRKTFTFFPSSCMQNDNGLTMRLRDVYYACRVIRYRRTKLNIKVYSLNVR